MRYRLAVAASAGILLAGATARSPRNAQVVSAAGQPGVQGEDADPCASQTDLMQCWSRQAEMADERMNAALAALQAKLGGDAAGELKRSQKAWQEYRNAHLAMLHAAGLEQRGKRTRIEILTCGAIARRQMAVERTREIKDLLEPQADDACPL